MVDDLIGVPAEDWTEEEMSANRFNVNSRFVKRVGCVILAAGESKRMSTNKLLLPVCGNVPMIRSVTMTSLHSSALCVIVIVNPKLGDTVDAIKDLNVEVISNDFANKGMSTSFQLGIKALQTRGMDGGVFLLGDMPGMRTSWIDKVIAAYLSSKASIVQASYFGVPSHPVLFDSSILSYATEIDGDQGGRSLVRRFSSNRTMVEMGAPCPIDLDTPEEYQAYRKQW